MELLALYFIKPERLKETCVRVITLLLAVTFLSTIALAQTGAPPSVPAPEVGGPLISGSDTGLNKVGDDGVSTKTVGLSAAAQPPGRPTAQRPASEFRKEALEQRAVVLSDKQTALQREFDKSGAV
jgi:hypothetical protein